MLKGLTFTLAETIGNGKSTRFAAPEMKEGSSRGGWVEVILSPATSASSLRSTAVF